MFEHKKHTHQACREGHPGPDRAAVTARGQGRARMLAAGAAILAISWLSPAQSLAQDNIGDLLADDTETIDAGSGAATTRSLGAVEGVATRSLGGGASFQASGDTDTMLQQSARHYETATGVVVIMNYAQEYDYWYPAPTGTAWAFQPNLLGTNGHVAEPVIQALQEGRDVYIVPNKSRGTSHRVVNAVVHPRYAEERPNVQGKKPVGIPYDIGVLEIEGAMENTVKLATPDQLQTLDAGAPVAFLGFPMENLWGGNVNLINPIATMQVGNITSISDYYLEDTGFTNNKLIRHNLPATGGASGSAIFLPTGEVVAALNAGNVNWELVRSDNGEITAAYRAPSAAQVNYAQRIDIIYDLLQR